MGVFGEWKGYQLLESQVRYAMEKDDSYIFILNKDGLSTYIQSINIKS
jgi:hypothetical protein